MTKDAVAADAWLKEVAPSTALRRWFNHQEERWEAFRRRYRKELDANPGAWQPILDAERRGTVTLLYSAHDVHHNSAVVLREYLVGRAAGSRGGKRQPRRPGARTRRTRTSTRKRRAA
jgi:uncharacterized protein YeaO (DUF488 family)